MRTVIFVGLIFIWFSIKPVQGLGSMELTVFVTIVMCFIVMDIVDFFRSK